MTKRHEEYVIANESLEPDGKRLFWSNDDGWVDRANCTSFTWRERYESGFTLPMGGVWWVIN